MNAHHHIKIISGIFAMTCVITIGAVASFAIPTLATDTGKAIAADRFVEKEDSLCAGQTWPYYNEGCRQWIASRSDTNAATRVVSNEIRNIELRSSILTKAVAQNTDVALAE
jgi:hypothetical protein